MNPLSHRPIALLPAALFLFSLPTSARAAIGSAETQYPEIVRLSYFEGDVRVNEGKAGKVELDGPWGQATPGMPIEEGFTVSTGTGRAEIEFESGWTAYLAENSTVEFNYIKTQENVAQSSLTILNGTLSVRFLPGQGETLDLIDPAGQTVHFATAKTVRVESFLDALSVTMEDKEGGALQLPNQQEMHVDAGHSMLYTADGAFPGAWGISKERSEWDDWVTGRIGTRDSNVAAALKASELSAPIPGLTELYADGEFFDCQPYGRCWAPSPQNRELRLQPPRVEAEVATSTIAGQQNSGSAAGNVSASRARPRYELFVRSHPGPHCVMTTETVERNRDTGEERVVNSSSGPQPWGVPLCHAGSFIYRQNGYTWVVGKKHHHSPCHWVKYHGGIGVVPWHPRDAAGKPPINLKHGVLTVSAKNPDDHQFVEVSELRNVAALRSPPKEFRRDALQQLAVSQRPQIQAKFISMEIESQVLEASSTPITYDYDRHSFVQESPTSPGEPVIVARVDSQGTVKALSEDFGVLGGTGSGRTSRSESGHTSGGITGDSRSGHPSSGSSGHDGGSRGVPSGGYSGSAHSSGGETPVRSGGSSAGSSGGASSGSGGSHESGGGASSVRPR